jgi:hypothetical protein
MMVVPSLTCGERLRDLISRCNFVAHELGLYRLDPCACFALVLECRRSAGSFARYSELQKLPAGRRRYKRLNLLMKTPA